METFYIKKQLHLSIHFLHTELELCACDAAFVTCQGDDRRSVVFYTCYRKYFFEGLKSNIGPPEITGFRKSAHAEIKELTECDISPATSSVVDTC